MRKIQPVARRFALEEHPDDRAEWLALPLEERLQAVWEMALFWAERALEETRARGETPEIAFRLLPIARKRPLGGENF
ncbi:aminodeoxychorismate lyase [Thermus sp.]|uniref:aminodeoxychorismate lyase n=1 Tax=Thermus sp. TaxID=275 RepID=UPI00307F6D35